MRVRLGLACVLFGGAGGAGIAFAAGSYEVVSKMTTVSSGTSGGVLPKCGKDARVTGGGFSSSAPYAVSAFFPGTKRGFAVTASVDAMSSSVDLSGFAICDSKGSYEVVEASRTVPDQDERSARARCPAGTSLAGGGARALGSSYQIRRSSPGAGREWIARLAYFGEGEGTVIAYAICDKSAAPHPVEKMTKTPPPEMRHLRGQSVEVAAKPECDGSRPTAGGFQIRGTLNNVAHATVPDGRRWKTTFRTYAGDDVKLTGYAVCGK